MRPTLLQALTVVPRPVTGYMLVYDEACPSHDLAKIGLGES